MMVRIAPLISDVRLRSTVTSGFWMNTENRCPPCQGVVHAFQEASCPKLDDDRRLFLSNQERCCLGPRRTSLRICLTFFPSPLLPHVLLDHNILTHSSYCWLAYTSAPRSLATSSFTMGRRCFC